MHDYPGSDRESSVFDEDVSNQSQSAKPRKRPRTFDAITFELEAYNKRPRVLETLEAINHPLRLCVPVKCNC